MLRSGESETEILLGNKQLLGIFFVVAALLGVAFVGGYKLGQGSSAKKTAIADVSTPASAPASSGGETHSVSATDSGVPAVSDEPTATASVRPLGARKPKNAASLTETAKPAVARSESFNPQGGQEFLQVAALAHDDANAVAGVLRKKGFHAHAVPNPRNANLFRVVIGPIRDAGDLSSTRDQLRKTGFRDVIVQRY